MPDRDYFVQTPKTVPGTGDTVLYSNRASTRPSSAGPVQSGERDMRFISGWYQADQASTLKLQGWDRNANAGAGGWVTLNNAGQGDGYASGTPATYSFQAPGGDWQLVVNFAVAPTVWSVPTSQRLSRAPQQI